MPHRIPIALFLLLLGALLPGATSVTLSVGASDDGLPSPPAALSYAWSVAGKPSGASDPVINQSGPAPGAGFTDTATATFASGAMPGTYIFRCTVSDGALSVTSDTTVQVKLSQSIAFPALPAKQTGDADFAPGASASSGLAVAYASSNTAVATIVGGLIRIVGPGTSTITATQGGNGTYAAATPVSQTLTVSAAPTLVLNRTALSVPEGGTATFTVRLGSAPAATTAVAVSRLSGDGDLTVSSGANLSFTTANWGTAQTVTLAAAQDADATAGSAVFRCAAAGLPTVDVTATEADDESSAPTVATPATAQPATVTGVTTALNTLGSDDGGEPALIYTWSTSGTPPAPVAFAPNGTNAAKNATATFTRAGSYTLVATIRDAAGQTATSSVTVTVTQTRTAVVVTPASLTVAPGASQAFSASTRDQFNQPLATQPAITWSVPTGGGSISTAGVYTAPSSPGTATVRATEAGGMAANAAVTIGSGSGGGITGGGGGGGGGCGLGGGLAIISLVCFTLLRLARRSGRGLP